MIKSFNPIKSRRPWPPISISHLFQQGSFSSWPLFFSHLGCFCLDTFYFEHLGYQLLPFEGHVIQDDISGRHRDMHAGTYIMIYM